MAAPVTVPRLGWSMEEGTLLEWLKHDGDPVRPGDMLFVLEGEKAAEEIEALDGGVLRLAPDSPQAGDRVKVGQLLAYLVAEGETVPVTEKTAKTPVVEKSAKAPSAATTSAGPAARRMARAAGVDLGQVAGSGPGGRVTEIDVREHRPNSPKADKPAITPRARRASRELGIDCKALTGTGRNGRIRERDVRAATSAAGGRLVPHTTIRRTIAARMVAGVTEAAPVTLTVKADPANLVNLREQFRAVPDNIVPSYTDLLVKLAAAALQRHPMLQAQWREDGLFVPDRVDIAVAVDTEAGLLTPVVRNADRQPLREIAATLRELIEKARAGRLVSGELRDATFTITNLGGLGVDAFTPIITLPQCAVLGVGRIVREPAVVGEVIVPRDRLTLSLTFDHRVVDGAPAARFLDLLRRCVEQPVPWLMP